MLNYRDVEKAVFIEIKMINSIVVYTNLVEVKTQEDVDNIIKDLNFSVENKVIESFGVKVLNNIKVNGDLGFQD